jgi:hypothetical protein
MPPLARSVWPLIHEPSRPPRVRVFIDYVKQVFGPTRESSSRKPDNRHAGTFVRMPRYRR